MQAAISVDAQALERMVRILPIMRKHRGVSKLEQQDAAGKNQQPAVAQYAADRLTFAAPSLVGLGRSISLMRMRVSARIAGAARMAVRKNTA